MPTALPPIPATKSTDTAKTTPPKRTEREESFKRMLNGARRQIKPKQQPEKSEKIAPPAPASQKPHADSAPLEATPEAADGAPATIIDEPTVPTLASDEVSESNDDAFPPIELAVVATPAQTVHLETCVEQTVEAAGEEITCGKDIFDVDHDGIAMPVPALVEPADQVTDVSTESVAPEPDNPEEAVAPASMLLLDNTASHSGPIDLSSIENEQTDVAWKEFTDVNQFDSTAATKTPERTSASDDPPASLPGRAVIPTDMARFGGENTAEESGEADTVEEAAEPETIAAASDKSPSVSRGAASDVIRFDAVLDAIAPADDAPPNPFLNNQTAPASTAKVTVPTTPVADPLEARFAEMNHPRILTAVQSELVPHGGTVRLRLDPPELGALQVRIDVRDGVLAASFQTSNDEATRLLTQSLQQLKTTLESQGVTVEKLHVHQAPREQFDGQRGGDDRREQQSPQQWQQQEQQRREMLQRMWRRVRDGRDPFDLVA